MSVIGVLAVITALTSLDMRRRGEGQILPSHLHVFIVFVPSWNSVVIHIIPLLRHNFRVNILNIPACWDCGIVCSCVFLMQPLPVNSKGSKDLRRFTDLY